MASRSTSRRSHRRGGGKHRTKKRAPEAYVWLGAGAITLGVGAALVGGAGAASATTGANESASANSSESNSSAGTSSSERSAAGESPGERDKGDDEKVADDTSKDDEDVEQDDGDVDESDGDVDESDGDVDESDADVDEVTTQEAEAAPTTAGDSGTAAAQDVFEAPEVEKASITVEHVQQDSAQARNGEVRPSKDEPAVDEVPPVDAVTFAVQPAVDTTPRRELAAAATGPVTSIPLGYEAKGFYIGADDRVFVLHDDRLSVFDKNNVRVGSINVGAQSSHLTVSANGRRVFVASDNGDLTVYDSATLGRIGSPVAVGDFVGTVAVNSDGSRAYVINDREGTSYLTVLNIGAQRHTRVKDIAIEGAWGAVISDDGRRVYVSAQNDSGDGQIVTVNTATNSVIVRVTVGGDMYGTQLNKSGTRLYMITNGRLGVVDTTTNRFLGTADIGSDPMWYRISPDGGRIYVTNGNANTVSVINTVTRQKIGTIRTGGTPVGITMSPDGRRIYVMNEQNNTLSAITVADGRTVATYALSGPMSIAASRDGVRVYGMNWDTNSLTVVNVAGGVSPAPTPTVSTPIPRPNGNNTGGSQASNPVKPAPKPAPKRDLGGAFNRAVIEVAALWAELTKLTGEDWARTISKDFPEVGRFLQKFLPVMNTLESLVDGSYKVTTGKNPVTGPLKVVAGIAGGVAIGLPVWPPQLIALKAVFGVAAGAISLVAIAIEAADPRL